MQTSQNVLTSLNVLTLVVEEVFWYSVCSKHKDIHTHVRSPCRLPEFARWGHQLSLVEGGDPQCCLHDGDELLVLHVFDCCGSVCCHDSWSWSFQSGDASQRRSREQSAAQRRRSSSEGADDEIKQQNSRVAICAEALRLHNSDRKSHHGRIIAALSLWVLRVVIHNMLPFSLSDQKFAELSHQSRIFCSALCHGRALPVQQSSRGGF